MPRAVGPAVLLTCDLHSVALGAAQSYAPVQLILPGFPVPAPPSRQGHRRLRRMARTTGQAKTPADGLLADFLQRLPTQGFAVKTRRAYAYQLRTVLRYAAKRRGQPVALGDLFQDKDLLGDALVEDRAIDTGQQLSRWTLDQRRSAIRMFVKLMRPELQGLLGDDPHDILDRALRRVAERVGTGYRVSGGKKRRRGGPVPTQENIAAVICTLGAAPGYMGLRNGAFFAILAQHGARVNALRCVDASACVVLPGGQVRLYLPEKGKAQPREVELWPETARALRAYMAAFNQAAALSGWRVRVQLGQPGAVWRNSARGTWSEADMRAVLRAACAKANVPDFTPHALRRAFATDGEAMLPRHVVALAGGWQGRERLDDHYVRPRREALWARLATAHPTVAEDNDEHRTATPALGRQRTAAPVTS